MNTGNGLKVLMCVDDEPIILMAMRQELRLHLKQQAAVDTCGRAEEALKRIDEYRNKDVAIILVISDWRMPGMNGDEFLSALHKRHPDIPMVLVTGQADQNEIDRLQREVGLFQVLRKPWRVAELRSIVDRVLDS